MAESIDVATWDEMNEHINDARDAGKRAVVLITAPSWCAPCRAFEKHWIRATEEVDDVVFVRVDYDNSNVGNYMKIQSVPHAMLFNEEGIFDREVKVPQGALPFINDIRS